MVSKATPLPRWPDLYEDPKSDAIDALSARLSRDDGPADEHGGWPKALWRHLSDASVPRWSLPTEFGGEDLDRFALLHRYARIGEGSLTAAFILSQHDAAVRRLVSAVGKSKAREWLGRIGEGSAFATVGVSHLTTSRRLGDQPMRCETTASGYRLHGTMPWVTAAIRADVIVSGAPLEDGNRILAAIPVDRPGMSVRPPFELAALQASCTGEVVCEGVEVDESDLLAGPALDVMAHANAAGTGGLETSALALGQARAALAGLVEEAPTRTELVEPLDVLVEAWSSTWRAMLLAAQGTSGGPTSGQVRSQANALVLRACQAFLAVRRGSGFLRGDPAQRWARQALFFLVWSCPTPVASATIRELAGVCSP